MTLIPSKFLEYGKAKKLRGIEIFEPPETPRTRNARGVKPRSAPGNGDWFGQSSRPVRPLKLDLKTDDVIVRLGKCSCKRHMDGSFGCVASTPTGKEWYGANCCQHFG